MNDAPPDAAVTQAAQDLATPLGRPSGMAGLLILRKLPYLAACIAIQFARLLGRPLRVGRIVIVARHADVTEALARDLDFCLQPVNAPKFDQIGFHFILGMDRSAELIAERRVLYTALADVDDTALQDAIIHDIADTLDTPAGPVDVVQGYARPIAAATASRLFGIAPTNKAALMDATRAIFGNSFLNPTGDEAMTNRALVAANLLSDWLETEIARRRATGEIGKDMMGRLLATGIGDDLVRRTLGGMLVGAVDTTATCVAKVITVLMGDQALHRRAYGDRGDLRLMRGWCNEALRRWAHGPLLMRKAARDANLAGTAVRAGDSVLLWTQAAMLDARAFSDPQTLRPDRPDASYLHFGGGLHPCAGRGINAWQIPMLVAGLLDRRPTKLGPMIWAGPFPAQLPIHLEGRP
jgi:cytochrome P450